MKQARNGNFWGALKTANKTSKLAQLKEVGVTTSTMPIDPAMIIVAATLYSVEQKLDTIIKLEKQILNFLETEKESQIEADIETLTDLICKYKNNWDNKQFITSSHKTVMDIQRTARKHIVSYKKRLEAALKSAPLIVSQSNVTSTSKDFQKKLEYYRLSLYAFSMASLIEIMLSGNFTEENILTVKTEIEKLSKTYQDMFSKCSLHLKKMSKSSVETNVLKGIGEAGKAFGKLIGDIPFVNDGQVDEFLQDGGKQLNKSAKNMEKGVVKSFSKMKNPQTSVFTGRMEELIKIYNHTSDICFDDENIYLIVS